MSEKLLNIYQRINAIMQDDNIYIKKGSAGHGTGVQYDEVIAVLAPLLTKHGVVISVDKHGDSRNRTNKSGSYIFECDYKISYINIDDPKDRLDSIVEAHAQDNGDKAPGKSMTYATKTSLLKVFGIESGDNEESRADLADTSLITEDEYNTLFHLICDENGMYTQKGQRIATAFKFTSISEIPARKYSAILKRAQS